MSDVAAEVAAVQQARQQLAEDLGVLEEEVRLEVSYRMEKLAWKLVAGLAGATAVLVVNKTLNGIWARVRPDPPPENPADPETGWVDGLIWAAATGIGMGVGKVVAQRGAALAWTRATGRVAPPFEKKVAKPVVRSEPSTRSSQ